jgi:hypothetical protein
MRGRLHLELRGPDGRLSAERRARNAVMRGGGELVARLFAGAGSPITHMGVGTSDAPESDTFATLALANADGLTGGTDVAIPADAFVIDTDPSRRVVLVKLRATLPPTVGVGTIREAGLLAKVGPDTTLYNRVTFAPVNKRSEDELSLFWEVSFPYGDVQWLM